MKTLKPQILKGVHYRGVEEQLRRIFYEILFRPVSAALRQFTGQTTDARKTLLNAEESALRAAIRKGVIQYVDGTFSGEFSAAIGRDLRTLGASFDKRSKVYRLPMARVPDWVKSEAALYKNNALEAHRMILKTLDDVRRDLDRTADIHTVDPHETIESIEDEFNRIAGNLVIDTQLSPASTARLTKNYSENMKLWIKKFSAETIGDLRTIVEKNATEGYRFDRLIKGIKTRYGVTASKAKFLARQETGLFMANYRKERFGEVGVKRYKWSTSHDSRVRPAPRTHGSDNHRVLDGRIFEYAKPPVVDPARNRRANPGEDYNCRCVDIPVLEEAA